MAFLGTLGFAGLFQLPKKLILPVSIGGMLGWCVYLVVEMLMPVEFVCYFAGALSVALYSEVLAKVFKVPVTVILVPGAIPLVPGGSLYYTMRYVVLEQYADAVTMAYKTASYAVAIAMGFIITMGAFAIVSDTRKNRLKSSK